MSGGLNGQLEVIRSKQFVLEGRSIPVVTVLFACCILNEIRFDLINEFSKNMLAVVAADSACNSVIPAVISLYPFVSYVSPVMAEGRRLVFFGDGMEPVCCKVRGELAGSGIFAVGRLDHFLSGLDGLGTYV